MEKGEVNTSEFKLAQRIFDDRMLQKYSERSNVMKMKAIWCKLKIGNKNFFVILWQIRT